MPRIEKEGGHTVWIGDKFPQKKEFITVGKGVERKVIPIGKTKVSQKQFDQSFSHAFPEDVRNLYGRHSKTNIMAHNNTERHGLPAGTPPHVSKLLDAQWNKIRNANRWQNKEQFDEAVASIRYIEEKYHLPKLVIEWKIKPKKPKGTGYD